MHTIPSRWMSVGVDLLVGMSVVVGLWLTVVPANSTDRVVQLGLAATAVAAAAARSRFPLVATMATAAATGCAWALGLTSDPFLLTALCVLVIADRRGSRRFPWWLLAGAAAVALLTLGFSAEGIEGRLRGTLLGALALTAAWVFGVQTRQVREAAAARQRAEARLSLARDVHDVLSHSLGTIGMRAGISAHVTTLGQSELRDALRDIEHDARTSLAELKSLLRSERANGSGGDAGSSNGTGTGNNAPPSVPLTAALTALADAATRSGLRVTLDLEGDLDTLPAPVRTTVHRVAQEAVTNAIRHACATSLIVAAQRSDDLVGLQVRDDGAGVGPSFREGHGLVGMRERVALVGGTVRAEAAAVGFVVSMSVPLVSLATAEGGRP